MARQPEEASPPFFVIRNTINTVQDADAGALEHKGRDEISTGSTPAGDENSQDLNGQPISITIVGVVEAPRGMYMLDYHDSRESLMSNFLAENTISEAGSDSYYLDGKAWHLLEEFAVLCSGEALLGRNDPGPFVLLEEKVKEVVHTLLSVDKLFSWRRLVGARGNGSLEWRDIRRFLAEVRRKVPFLTHDGVLKRVVNTHLTFHQFVAFSRLITRHLEAAANEPLPEIPDIKIYDLFPSFESMDSDDQVIELSASIKDKASRDAAHSAEINVPQHADELVSITECNEEWQLYTQWWQQNVDDVRSKFIQKEILFAENDAEVRRNAEKDGVSMRGRHSGDPTLREQFLRRYATWYLGLEVLDTKSDAPIVDLRLRQPLDAKKHATKVNTFDFLTGCNVEGGTDLSPRLSPLGMPTFKNTAWKPVAKADESRSVNGDGEEFHILAIQSAVARSRGDSPSIPVDVGSEDGCEDEENDVTSISTAVASSCDEEPGEEQGGDIVVPLIVGSSIKPAKRQPFRQQFLRRLTSEIDNLASLLNGKAASELRGIELFRSKVRLVILLLKFSSASLLLQQLDKDNVDIFKASAIKVPEQRPVTPKQQVPDVNMKELFAKAKAHRCRVLCRISLNALTSWRLVRMREKEEKREAERKRLEEQQRIREKAELLRERLLASQRRRMLQVCIKAFQGNAIEQKQERAKKEVQPEPEATVEVKVEEEWPDTSFVARPPGVERKFMDDEDRRSHGFRNHCQKWLLLDSSHSREMESIELQVFGRRRRSGLDVVNKDEYDQHFASSLELENIPPQQRSSLALLDKATLQQMLKEKLRGGSNLFDVPKEFTDFSSPPSERNSVEYRSKEVVEGLLLAADLGEKV